jgi:hypothetical protein
MRVWPSQYRLPTRRDAVAVTPSRSRRQSYGRPGAVGRRERVKGAGSRWSSSWRVNGRDAPSALAHTADGCWKPQERRCDLVGGFRYGSRECGSKAMARRRRTGNRDEYVGEEKPSKQRANRSHRLTASGGPLKSLEYPALLRILAGPLSRTGTEFPIEKLNSQEMVWQLSASMLVSWSRRC